MIAIYLGKGVSCKDADDAAHREQVQGVLHQPHLGVRALSLRTATRSLCRVCVAQIQALEPPPGDELVKGVLVTLISFLCFGCVPLLISIALTVLTLFDRGSSCQNQYNRRIEDIDKWLRKYKADPHELYAKICKPYGLRPKPQIKKSSGKQKQKQRRGSSKKSWGQQYCSVYEFSSPQPDSAYLPHWMLQNLGLEEGDKVELQSQFAVAKGTFCRLQPLKQEFMDKVSTIGYKSTLEHSLRHYSVLAVNQRIVVEFNHFPYECIVRELKPTNVVSILGSTDLEIEFDAPLEADLNHAAYDEKTEDKDQAASEESEDSSSLGLGACEVCYLPDGVIDGIVATMPISRVGQVEDQVHACLFLLSDEASFITGQAICVSGGLTMG